MFTHHKIPYKSIDGQWLQLKRTISPNIAYQSAEVIGQCAAKDMLYFSNIDESNVSKIFVKYRDGLPMAAGISKILPKSDIIYVTTIRWGPNNKEVDIAIDVKDFNIEDPNFVLWFADPINARGTTAISVLRKLTQQFSFDTALISHIVANRVGINGIQTLLTDFHIRGFMNYAFLSEKLDEKTGYLKDGLEIIPDFGDKVFGTIGSDYPQYLMQEDIKNLLGTKVGEAELIKGVILFLLQLHGSDEYISDRRSTWATKPWIRAAILWFIKMRNLPINIDISQHFDLIFDDLKDRGYISYKLIPYKKSQIPIYNISDPGVKLSTKTYLPIFYELGYVDTLKKDFDFLVHLDKQEIIQNIQNENT